eukprot:791068_1
MLSTLNEWYESVNKLTPTQKTKMGSVGVGLAVGYILYKIHTIGSWKYKMPNKSIPIIFYRPGTGTLLWVIENADDNFHPKFTTESLRLIKQTKEKFIIWSGIKVAQNFNNTYFIYCPKIVKLIFEDRSTEFIKGPHVQHHWNHY